MKMNKIFNLLALGVCIATLTGCTSTSNNTQDYISEDQAKAIALEHAGVSESEVSFVLSKFDLDDGIAEYEVEFYSDSTEFDYEIDAISGEIRSYDFDMENKPTTTPAQQDNATNQDYISEDQAKAIALEHAGVSENEVSFVLSKFDLDDGIAEYEVEFYSDSTEFDYEIDAISGEVRSYDFDMENKPTTTPSQQDTATNQDYISEDQAKSIAFAAASINEKDAEYVKCEFDYDDGRAEYEVEWSIGRTEYEYTIDAIDGSIREYDIEQDD